MSQPTEHSTAVLTVDLEALANNYRTLCAAAGGKLCAAVVKADAYGVGMERVVPILESVGCTAFFVATLDEAIALRALSPDCEIHMFNGLLPGMEKDLQAHRIVPVLNDLGQIERWSHFCRWAEERLPADIHFDTGMNRLGLSKGEQNVLFDSQDPLSAWTLDMVVSHLACADEIKHPMNTKQLSWFERIRATLSSGRASLANSSGIYLGPDYHFDVPRPGCALYGVNPRPEIPNPMSNVVRLQGRVLQVRDVDSDMSVGYGATHTVEKGGKIATIAVGYADGYLRCLGNLGITFINDVKLPVVGRVSMDLITIDITDAPEGLVHPGVLVDIIGPHNPVDTLADKAGTIGYEILTSLGSRYHRVYTGGIAPVL